MMLRVESRHLGVIREQGSGIETDGNDLIADGQIIFCQKNNAFCG